MKDHKIIIKKNRLKSGMFVIHREAPNITMVVDKICKKNKKIKVDGKEIDKLFTIGVKCHWMDVDGKYWTGMFHTRELIEKEEPSELIEEPKSMPDEEYPVFRHEEGEGDAKSRSGTVDKKMEGSVQ